MAFDFKKEYKDFYRAKAQPQLVRVPPMRYLAVSGTGDPNQPDGAYKQAVEQLYTVAYTLKMSKKGDHRIDGYFDFVVPPLEGFWEQDGVDGFDLTRKDLLRWTSVIRVPEFVTNEELTWAIDQAARKKKTDCAAVELLSMEEGECVQILHVGPFDNEADSVALMDEFLAARGYANDFSAERRHHEIYLSDARRVVPEKWRTIVRHPVRKL